MTLLMAILFLIALAIILLPVLVLFIQVVMAIPPIGTAATPDGRRPRIAILIPAHNEEGGVAATIASVLPQLQEGDRVLVVADNCSDNTAGAATRAGAEVCERFNESQRGKGYALDFGVRSLTDNPPEVMIIVDADCIVTEHAIDRLARTALCSGRPVQALYLMRAPKDSGPMKKIAEFAWIVKNLVRPLGFARLGLPCQLMGSGMAFPWTIISSASLANGHIVEDMKLGMDLAETGTPPLFCPHAMVYSTFPASTAGTNSQRTRWEHGHLSMIINQAPKLLVQGICKSRLGMVVLALDLCVPPLALLTLLVLVLFSCAALFGMVSGVLMPMGFATLILFALGMAILMSWWRYGREILSASNLAMAFFYMFWKIPLYLRFFVNRQVEWVRSKRDHE
jgi:cellulose synthase/poly-beta-1,6-N-acetylglucosamine synthase-like glycosyltransferase